MNKAIIEQLAYMLEWIEPQKFHMGHWFGYVDEKDLVTDSLFSTHYAEDRIAEHGEIDLMHTCGTTACIAGWAIAMHNGNIALNLDFHENVELARKYLGLTRKQADRLFFFDRDSVWAEKAEELRLEQTNAGNISNHENITNKMAANILRKIASGEIVL